MQFQVRDADVGRRGPAALLAGRDGDGALVFTCNGRGMRLFGEPDHDAAVVAEHVGGGAVAGMFCAGELGPVGGRTVPPRLHRVDRPVRPTRPTGSVRRRIRALAGTG